MEKNSLNTKQHNSMENSVIKLDSLNTSGPQIVVV
jgi:hypothetical protein